MIYNHHQEMQVLLVLDSQQVQEKPLKEKEAGKYFLY